MMQLERLGFIVFRINLMYLILLRNKKLWLRLRQERSLSVSDQTMEVNIAAKILIGIFQSMEFVERRQFQENHKKMVCEKG